MLRNISGLLLCCTLLFAACKKDPAPVAETLPEIRISFDYHSGNLSLFFDSLLYTNAAGENYSVSRLEYFISNITLHAAGGDVADTRVHYLCAGDQRFSSITLRDVPLQTYSGISFLFGVDSLRNVPDGLAPNLENNAMFWPVPMGGGYHFMKLEGRYHSGSDSAGYAIHLGRNGQTVQMDIPSAFTVSAASHQARLSMNINEWFENPQVYSFVSDGRYTMSSLPLMRKIAANGKDVFTFEFQP